MDEQTFIKEKQESWKELSEIVELVQRAGTRALNREQLKLLGCKYRTLLSDLSTARTQGASEDLVLYLNELAGNVHAVLFNIRPARAQGALKFFTHQFPCLFRSTYKYFLAATFIFLLGSFFAAYLVSIDPALVERWTPPRFDDPAHASSWIMANNIRVGILAFVSGMTAGVLTVLIIFNNGIILGAVAMSLNPTERLALWSFVAPHGIIELTAIFICGAAGLIMGAAFIAPGNLRRIDAIKLAAGKSVRLFVGTLPFYIIAALIEGFFSPVALPHWVKFAFSGLSAVCLILYLGFSGNYKKANWQLINPKS